MDSLVFGRLRVSESRRIGALLTASLLFSAGIAFAEPKTCAEMQEELGRLRQAYHEYATTGGDEPGGVTFGRLAAMLDEIVALKRTMRRSNCQAPPRSKQITLDRDSTSDPTDAGRSPTTR